MKRILTIITLLTLSASAMFAQKDNFKAHFFGQLQGGAAYTVGEAPFGQLISPNAAISFGYHFTPAFKTRLNLEGWQAKGAAITDKIQIYNFQYATLSADLMFDLCNVFSSYKANRFMNPYLFLGAGVAGARHNCPAHRIVNNAMETDNKMILDKIWTGPIALPEARTGMGVDFRITNNLAFNTELNCTFLPDNFNSKSGSDADFQIAALAGITYKFGKVCTPAPVVEEAAEVAPTPAPAPKKEEVLVVEQPEKVVVVEDKPIVNTAPKPQSYTENVFFLIRKWVIRPSEQAKIDKLVELLKANPNARITISAYADKETGNAKINKHLSDMRAQIVEKALVSAGIAKDRITTYSFGDTKNPFPVAEQNRVSICVVE